jgi:hypothetical protein
MLIFITQVNHPVPHADEDTTADNITDRHRDQVVGQETDNVQA